MLIIIICVEQGRYKFTEGK